MNNNIFYCQLCNMRCNTAEQFRIHTSGQIHQKELKKSYIGGNGDQLAAQVLSETCPFTANFPCSDCNKSMNTQEQYDNHCAGQPHKRKVQTRNSLIVPVPDNAAIVQDVKTDFIIYTTCGITMHNNQLASHLIGKEHIKKRSKADIIAKMQPQSSAIVLNPKLPPDFFLCQFCNIKIDSKEQYDIHCQGCMLHRNNESVENQACATSNITVHPNIIEGHLNENEQMNKSRALENVAKSPILQVQSEDSQRLSVAQQTPNANHCTLCNRTMDTINQYSLHCLGSGHVRRLKNLSITNSASQLPVISTKLVSCDVCKIQIDVANKDSHFSGKKHRETVKKTKEASPNLPEKVPTTVEGNFVQSPQKNNEEVVSPVISSQITDLLIPVRSENNIKCQLCNKIMNTEEQYTIHCNGGRHRRRMTNLNIPDTGSRLTEIGLILCPVCNISIHNNNLESHYTGKQHKENMEKQKKQCTDNSNQGPLITRDGHSSTLFGKPSLVEFEVVEIVGRGSYGRVYKCYDRNINLYFAKKEVYFNPENSSNSKTKSLRNEINIYEKLPRHERIVHYFGAKRGVDSLNIFMEFISRGSLKNILTTSGPFAENVIATYTRQILEGLEFLHSHKIIHRDIKCANILLSAIGNIKLSDFGTSKSLLRNQDCDDNSNSTTMGKTSCGTVHWMAPEVLRAERHSYPADVWSLGVTIIEMLTCKPIYHDLSDYQFFLKLENMEILKYIKCLTKSESNELQIFICNTLVLEPEKQATIKALKKLNFILPI